MNENTTEAEDRPPGRIKTGNDERTFSWVGVTPRGTATHEGTGRHIFKKDDTGGHLRVKEDTTEAEDRPPRRIKTGNDGRTFS